MDENVGNLLESLGYAEDFFHDASPYYGVSDMLEWLENVQNQDIDLLSDPPNEKQVISKATGLPEESLDHGIEELKQRLERWREEFTNGG